MEMREYNYKKVKG